MSIYKPSSAIEIDDPYPWLEGERISVLLARVVVKCPRENGQGFVAKKVAWYEADLESEAYMLKYAVEVAGVNAPRFHRVYLQGEAKVMVTDYDLGERLDTVWHTLSDANKISIKRELQEQIRRMRRCTMSLIGRVNLAGDIDGSITFPDPCHPSKDTNCTAFASEKDFDAHKIAEVREDDSMAAVELEEKIEQLSGSYTEKFVLTHGDLNARNIHVVETAPNDAGNPENRRWRLSSILDWEKSGFFPEYMEYAIARNSISHDPERRQFLCELLKDLQIHCAEKRVEVEYMAMDNF